MDALKKYRAKAQQTVTRSTRTVSGLKTQQGRTATDAESSRTAMSAQHETPDIRQEHSDDGAEPVPDLCEKRGEPVIPH